jgi:hypothetical protein
MAQVQTELELYRSGEKVLYSGKYILVDEQGNKQNFALATLNEGETFPELAGQFRKFCYTLSDTCPEEQ